MDVTFTNVLEGARQYFQGLPTGSNSAVSPAYSSESHLRHEYERNIPTSSNAYWSSHASDAVQPARDHNALQREHAPVQREQSVLREHASVLKDHSVIHRPSSHGSDSSSHLSQYGQTVPVSHEQNRQYYAASYQEHYQQHIHQQQQQPIKQQSHQQHQSQLQQQSPVHYQQQRQPFEFSRPQNTNYTQYQSHLPNAGSPYQQSPSPYHQIPSPQQPRAPSREQMVPRVPSREQTIPRVPSHEQSAPRTSQYSQSSDTYNYTQSVSYYQQTKNETTNNVPYKHPVEHHYPSATSQQQQQQQQQKMYYKHVYGPQQTHQSVFAASRQEEQLRTIRTTHNLPPIAAISHYHSNRAREPVRPTPATANNKTRTYSSNSYQSNSHNIQQTSTPSNYQQYQPITTTTTTQSYNQVVMTTTCNYYANANQNQSSSNRQFTAIPSRNVTNEPPVPSNIIDNTNRVVVVKRESPLDLSVKTIRTPADSTLIDAENERTRYRPNQTLTAHNYPQLDVNSFQRNLTQRSTQLTAATAPKVEFRPNFNVPTLPKRSTDNKVSYKYSIPTSDNIKSKPRTVPPTPRFVSNEQMKKRSGEIALPPTVPNKLQKLTTDAWRQSIDLQIEERLSSYKQQQAKLSSPTKIPLVNGYDKPNYEHTAFHTQTYVPSAGTHQYPGYNPKTTNNNNNNSLTNSKNTVGVDKRVLSLLRNSLEVKGQKKLEQLKSNENFSIRSDIQHPSTDVTAPLQPKPVFVNRNNVSPFTPTSFPDNNNITASYKFHIPKAVDSINFDTNKTNRLSDKEDTVINNNVNTDCDGLAAFLAARIRTKGELKQGGNNNKSQLHDVIEKQLKSNIKQYDIPQLTDKTLKSNIKQYDIPQVTDKTLKSPVKHYDIPQVTDKPLKSPVKHYDIPQVTAFCGSGSTPPKSAQKDRPQICSIAPRKRLFSRNEDDSNIIPIREAGLRSSSETSVFDFPDSDSENDVNKESLEAMRKCRKSVKTVLPIVDLKQETTHRHPLLLLPPAPPTPSDDTFSQVCDNFLEQLKSGIGKKKCKKKKTIERLDDNAENGDEVIVKIEKIDDEIKVSTCEIDLNKVKEETDVKQEEDLFVIKRKNVRRRILSSSDSSDDENDKSEVKVVDDEVKTTEEEIKGCGEKISELTSAIRPSKKPSFGDGSAFYPGWEEGVYKYKKSLRMPPTLIQVTRPPVFHRLSTSLPDLDPCPQSPTASIPNDDKDAKIKEKRIKSEPDSDAESNYSDFNVFSKKINYDSEGSCSIKSLPNTPAGKETSILDRLLEKCGGRKRKKYKRKDDHSPKTVPKSENPVELLPTPSLEIKQEDDKKTKKLSNSPVIKAESPLLGFRKSTMSNFKDAFLKRSNNILNNQFTTVVLNSRTRRETRVQKQRATIKEVFGEDRPASAPPVTCLNDIQIKEENASCLGNLVVRLEKKDDLIREATDLKRDTKRETTESNKDGTGDPIEPKPSIKIETEDSMIDEDTRSLDDVTVKSETASVDGDDGSASGRKRGKFGKIRRKFSSGFDYIRKKKKVKKDAVENESAEKKKKKSAVSKTLESVDDIQREIKTWVLNKGIGETHLHRAARLGYTDVTAYCLEKTDCPPSPRDNAGYTPLHWACSKGHLQIAKLLLLYGANPSESAQGGIRPLHEAVENGFVEIARLLLSYGADPTLATYSGLTPLALTNDEVTKDFLMNHLNDIEGEVASQWYSTGPASIFDPVDQIGFNVLDNVPSPDPEEEEEDIDFEMSESLLPNLYTLCNEPPTDRWVLLQDLSTILKIKSRDALLKQICPPSTSGVAPNNKNIIRELRMPEFLDQARCCQFLNAGEKINTRANKIALVKYTDKVRELLNIESVVIKAR
ncbi:putative mediator of RNA polymerase II transcription subunit 26 [Diorhabda carinulata]|uniref:putative mediator of RNA polymerase II transcription subunit 26 n=1 Tax=Diorhabda carinulata TaxID=1163345 RepID=UPI0025A0FD50|nr:putative mediator of RNA polymerase II transcription subunit 26 [Diorhabda carinulata]